MRSKQNYRSSLDPLVGPIRLKMSIGRAIEIHWIEFDRHNKHSKKLPFVDFLAIFFLFSTCFITFMILLIDYFFTLRR